MGVNEIRNFGCVLLFINTRKKPFDDPRVRRAIHLAVSRRDVIRAQESQGSFGKWTRWIPHGDPFETPTERIGQIPGYRDDKTEDIQTARKLMAEAGYTNGASGIDFLISNLASDIDILGPAFKEQLKRTLNIETKLRPVERSLLAQEEAQGRFDLALDVAGHIISDVSPLGHTYWKTGAPNNFGGYSSKKFDDLLTQYDAATDDGKRREIADQMQDALDQDPPWYLMGYTFHLPMWQKAFKGISLDSRAFVQWGAATTAWLDK
jgi:peptide/nickel transport system substrate-binding protein